MVYFVFLLFLVAARVLRNVKLDLEGYLLQFEEKQPELFLPPNRKKLYVENIDPKTTRNSLCNYIEVRAKMEVRDIQFGKNGSALVTFNEEPGIHMCVMHCGLKFKLPLILWADLYTKELDFNPS